MVELSELDLRILATLEEARRYDVESMFVETMDASGAVDEVQSMQKALENLLQAGLITMTMWSIPSGHRALDNKEARAEVQALTTNMIFDSQNKYWADRRQVGPPYYQVPMPQIILTELGYERAVDALDKRGFQWWRSKE
jgi:hypothetical protein